MGRIIVMGLFVLFLCAYGTRELVRRWSISHDTWEGLLCRLDETNTAGITQVALEYQNPELSAISLAPGDRFAKIGGWRGVRIMRANAMILIALAAHAEHWRPSETLDLVKQLRVDGVVLRAAPYNILRERLMSRRRERTIQVQRAADAYYRMTQRLRQTTHRESEGRSTALASALWARSHRIT